MEKYLTSRSLILLSVLVCAGYFIYLNSFADFMYLQYDAYYYGAVADGLFTDGSWSNRVTVPPSNLRTPQNAIIVVHALLRALGMEDLHSRMLFISAANSVLICLIAYMCFRLFTLARFDQASAWLLALSVPLTFYYQMVWLMPINDTAFAALALLTLLLVLGRDSACDRRCITTVLVLAVSISFFRLAGALVFLAFVPMRLLQKQYRGAAGFTALFLISLFSPLLLNQVLGFNLDNLHSRSGEIIGGFDFGYFVDHLVKTVSLSLPEALLRITHFTSGFTLPHPLVGSLISLVLLGLLGLSTWQAWKQHNRVLLTLLGMIVLQLAFFQIHPAQPTRYLLGISALLPLLLCLPNWQRYHWHIAQVFVLTIVILSVSALMVSDNAGIGRQKREYAQQIRAFLQDQESLQLISYFPRISYFLHQRPAARSLQDALAAKPRQLLLFGPGWYIGKQLEDLQALKIPAQAGKLPFSYQDYVSSKQGVFGEHVELAEIQSFWVVMPDE